MRTLETILLAALMVVSSSLFVAARRRHRLLHVMPAFAVACALLQLWIEKFRWQMVPAYLLAMLLLVFTPPNIRLALRPATRETARDRKWTRRVGAAASVLLLVIGSAVPTLFPQYDLPEPTGRFAVGVMDLFLVDTNRPETFTEDRNDHRELSARIWYPAEASPAGEAVSYGEHAGEIGRILTRGTPYPSFLFDSLSLIDTHSYRGAALPDGGERFPVVIFSHAYWGGLAQSTVLMEELASHGYVAVSIAHAHETPYLIDGDGRIRRFDPRNAEFRLRGEERKRALGVQQEIVRTNDRSRLEALFRGLARTRPKTVESLGIWTADISFVIDELGRRSAAAGFFRDRLDTDRIGVIGHSFGGAASGQACLQDRRCKAGVNLDGIQLGDMLEQPLGRPFLFVHHDNATALNKTPNRILFERAKSASYLVLVRGTRHLDFSDLSLHGRGSLLRLAGALGSLPGRRCLRLQADYVLAFFDKHLKSKDSGLLDGPSADYPEVEIWVRSPEDP